MAKPHPASGDFPDARNRLAKTKKAVPTGKGTEARTSRQMVSHLKYIYCRSQRQGKPGRPPRDHTTPAEPNRATGQRLVDWQDLGTHAGSAGCPVL